MTNDLHLALGSEGFVLTDAYLGEWTLFGAGGAKLLCLFTLSFTVVDYTHAEPARRTFASLGVALENVGVLA